MEESSLSASEGEIDGEIEGDGSEDDIRELRARRHALTHKLAQQQKRRDKIQVSQDAIFIYTHCLLLMLVSVSFTRIDQANELELTKVFVSVLQAVLQMGGQLEIEIRPFYLVPDTNGFIDHLEGLRKLLACGTYILVVPLIGETLFDH